MNVEPQGFVVDIMVNRGLVGCIPPYISEVGVGVIIKVQLCNVSVVCNADTIIMKEV